MTTIREMGTPQLIAYREILCEHLTWGLSRQLRKATEIKIRAIELTLEEREDAHEQRAS